MYNDKMTKYRIQRKTLHLTPAFQIEGTLPSADWLCAYFTSIQLFSDILSFIIYMHNLRSGIIRMSITQAKNQL